MRRGPLGAVVLGRGGCASRARCDGGRAVPRDRRRAGLGRRHDAGVVHGQRCVRRRLDRDQAEPADVRTRPGQRGHLGRHRPPGPYGADIVYSNATPGFQCVELADRFLAVVDGLAPVFANGQQVAANYHAAYANTSST